MVSQDETGASEHRPSNSSSSQPAQGWRRGARSSAGHAPDLVDSPPEYSLERALAEGQADVPEFDGELDPIESDPAEAAVVDELVAAEEFRTAVRQFQSTAGRPQLGDASRLRHDAIVCQQLRKDGARGLRWEQFMTRLVSQCLPVVRAWLRTETFFLRSGAAGLRRVVEGTTRSLPQDDLDELAQDIIVAGEKLFREQGILGGRWTQAKGACLQTYFLNACIREFANVFRKWRRHRRDWSQVDVLPDLAELAVTTTDQDSGYAVNNTAVFRHILAQLGETERAVLWLYYAHGYTQEQIGSFIGKTRKAVEHIVARSTPELKDTILACAVDLDLSLADMSDRDIDDNADDLGDDHGDAQGEEGQ